MKTVFRIVSFIGSVFTLFFLGLLAPYMYSGGNPWGLVVIGGMGYFLFIPFAALVLTYGVRHAIWASAGLGIFLRREPLDPLQQKILGSAIRYIYATGAIALVLQFVMTMGGISGPYEEIGEHIAHGLVVVVYAVVLAEFIIRPAILRSDLLREEKETGKTHPTFRQMWLPTLFWLALYVGIFSYFVSLIIIAGCRK